MAIYKLKQTSFAVNAFESVENVIPAANVIHSLGTPEFQWKDLYLSGSTINLGGAQLKTNPTSGAIAFVPAPTEENPNPKATVVSATGTIAAVDTTGGDIDEGDVANAAANTSSIFTDLEATGNITANIFIGDGGLLSNITGVTAETVTGVLTAGDQIVIDSNGLITANVTAGSSVTIASSAPEGASAGDLYWDSDLGKLFIYYEDADTSQWVEATAKVANVVASLSAGSGITIEGNGLISSTATSSTPVESTPHPFLLAGM